MERTRVVFETEFFKIVEEHFENVKNLHGKPFYRLESGDGVIILPITRNHEVVLVRQFRPALHAFSLELPCGDIDEGEQPIDAARRELYEETGYVCESIAELGSGGLLMNRTSTTGYCFLAKGVKKDPNHIDREDIEAIEVPLSVLKEMMLDGRFNHLAAISLFALADLKAGTKLLCNGE